MKKISSLVLSILIGLIGLILILFIALSIHNSPGFAWRIITMQQSDTGDINRFPSRPINNGESISVLPIMEVTIPSQVTFNIKE